jgi:transposase-like protein
MRFRSSIIPPWCRKSPKVAEVLPLMYLHGMSSGDFVPALEEFFGSAAGLSSSVITRLTRQWQAERDAFMRRDLSGVDYVYVWVDGIHFNIRLEEERLCTLVVVGVRVDGTKELVALADGYRESTDSWADLLRDPRVVTNSLTWSLIGLTMTEQSVRPRPRTGSTLMWLTADATSD